MKHVVDVDVGRLKRKLWLRQFGRDNITRQRISHVNNSVSEIVFTLFLHLVNPSLQFSVVFWHRRTVTSSNFRLTAGLLKRPFASAANSASERTVSQCERRKLYGNVRVKKRTTGQSGCLWNISGVFEELPVHLWCVFHGLQGPCTACTNVSF